jgi:hypothetical protein
MPYYNKSTRDVAAALGLGLRVDRATAVPPQTAVQVLFNVEVGRVLVTLVLGTVTTVIGNVATILHMQSDPDTGTTTDMCVAALGLDIDSLEAGTLLTITGTVTDAMQAGSSGSVIGQATPVVVAPGEIEIETDASCGTGSIQWSIWYVPLEAGAYIAVA